jgi:hypothetical protein
MTLWKADHSSKEFYRLFIRLRNWSETKPFTDAQRSSGSNRNMNDDCCRKQDFYTEMPPSEFHRTTFTDSMVRIIAQCVHLYSLIRRYLGYWDAEWANSRNKNWISWLRIWSELHHWLTVLSLHHLMLLSLINLVAFPASSQIHVFRGDSWTSLSHRPSFKGNCARVY